MKKLIFALVATAAFALAACAPKPAAAADWNYIGGGYTSTDLANRSADGFVVNGSVEVTENLFAQAAYRNGFDSDAKQGIASLGLGLKTALTDKVDVYGLVSGRAIVDDRQSFDKYGFDLEGGVRAMVAPKLELRAAAVAFNLDDGLPGIRYAGKVGAEYALTKSLRLGADVLAKDDLTELQLGARWYF